MRVRDEEEKSLKGGGRWMTRGSKGSEVRGKGPVSKRERWMRDK